MNRLTYFLRDEDGAITVDWVVITAAVVALAITTVGVVKTAATHPAEGIGATLTAIADGDITF